MHASLQNWSNILLIQSFIMRGWGQCQTLYNENSVRAIFKWQKVLSSNICEKCLPKHTLAHALKCLSKLQNYSLASSTFPPCSQSGLFSIMAYGKGGTSQLGKSSFLGTLQLLKSSFLSRARLLMLPGGLPGLTLYPAALVVPRGLPGLVLNPAALVVPSGRPVLVR